VIIEPTDATTTSPRVESASLCAMRGDLGMPTEFEADLSGSQPAESVRLDEQTDGVHLLIEGPIGSIDHVIPVGLWAAAESTASDLTGDGIDDLAVCGTEVLNDSVTHLSVISGHGGDLRVVLDTHGLPGGALSGSTGTLFTSETVVLQAGQCVFSTRTRYDWDGGMFRPSGNEVTVEVEGTPECAGFLPKAGNAPPTPGFTMAFTDLGAVEGETLLVEGIDDGSVALCAAPADSCEVRTSDTDGQIVRFGWYLNGRGIGSESQMLVDTANFRDGYNTVTLMTLDDNGAAAFVSGFVDRRRP
jgi:hypothetical protein